MKSMKEIEIPFGAKDSELKGWEYTIPEGMEAEIKDGKIVVREKESEDERIINQLITLVDSTGEVLLIPTNKEELIAWLKKQKENPKSADSIPSDCVSDAKCEDRSPKHSDSDGTDIRDTPAYWKGWDDAMKQKEQKHPNGCFTCDEYKKGYEAGRSNGFTAGYNKAMKEVEQKEQKPAEWSEEDERMLSRCEKSIESSKQFADSDTFKKAKDNEIDWLENRFKSLRPSWKPSKEQMDRLFSIVAALRKDYCDDMADAIAEIYYGLEKLM